MFLFAILHPLVIGPQELRRMWKSSEQNLNFDAVVSFSSIEHSGLGRYGDALNPWGDLIASAQAWYITWAVIIIYTVCS